MPRKLSAWLLAASTGMAVAFSTPATPFAQDLKCWPREMVARNLERRHGETPAFQGFTTTGHQVEIFANKDGTFTLTFTFPDGLTCPFTSGWNWRAVPAVIPGSDS